MPCWMPASPRTPRGVWSGAGSFAVRVLAWFRKLSPSPSSDGSSDTTVTLPRRCPGSCAASALVNYFAASRLPVPRSLARLQQGGLRDRGQDWHDHDLRRDHHQGDRQLRGGRAQGHLPDRLRRCRQGLRLQDVQRDRGHRGAEPRHRAGRARGPRPRGDRCRRPGASPRLHAPSLCCRVKASRACPASSQMSVLPSSALPPRVVCCRASCSATPPTRPRRPCP